MTIRPLAFAAAAVSLLVLPACAGEAKPFPSVIEMIESGKDADGNYGEATMLDVAVRCWTLATLIRMTKQQADEDVSGGFTFVHDEVIEAQLTGAATLIATLKAKADPSFTPTEEWFVGQMGPTIEGYTALGNAQANRQAGMPADGMILDEAFCARFFAD